MSTFTPINYSFLTPAVVPPTVTGPPPLRPGTQVPNTIPTPPTGPLQGINDFISSPLGQMAFGTLFGFLNSKGQEDFLKQQLASQLQNSQATTMVGALGNALSGQQQNTLTRDLATQNPLGAGRDYSERVAMRPLALAMLGQGGPRPSDPRIAAAMGNAGRNPLAGIDPAILNRLKNLWSEDAVQQAIYDKNRQDLSINPNATGISMNYNQGSNTEAQQRALDLQRAQTRARLDAANQNQLSTLHNAMARYAPPSSSSRASAGSSAANRISGGLSGAASGASIGSMFAPGIGTGIGAAIGGLMGLFRR